MGYEVMGWLHARVVRAWARERGQGTVEYVGLILLVAVILAGVVTASGTVLGQRGSPTRWSRSSRRRSTRSADGGAGAARGEYRAALTASRGAGVPDCRGARDARRPRSCAAARSASSTPGVGGLTVLHELLVRLPHEDFVYLARRRALPVRRRARPRSSQAFALEIAEELLARRIEAARRGVQLGDRGGAAGAARAG